jgi:Acetyl xylan esterase (AXE1)
MAARRRRNLSPYEAFLAAGRANVPRFAYRDGMDVAHWCAEARPAVLATLGRLPERVDPDPELLIEFEYRGVIVQRWLIDVADGLSAVAIVNRPVGPAPEQGFAGLLCWHGHGRFGKEPVMGNAATTAVRDYVAETGLDYGLRMALAGYVTFGIDWMGSGDRNDSLKPNGRPLIDGDWCNTLYLNATLLGQTVLGMNLAHGQRLLDFVVGLDFVDADRIGVMGESYGGTLAVWTTLLDERIKATEIICYSDTFADFALRDLNYCGSQITPGLFTLVDVSDLHGLIAPRPLLTDISVFDDCFRIESSSPCVDRVEAIYAAAGASDRFARQLFDHIHGWQERGSADFFGRHLQARQPSGR